MPHVKNDVTFATKRQTFFLSLNILRNFLKSIIINQSYFT